MAQRLFDIMPDLRLLIFGFQGHFFYVEVHGVSIHPADVGLIKFFTF